MQIGRYTLQECIGSGTISVVHRAVETDSGRIVVVKLLARALAFNAYARAQLLREVTQLAALQHPQIVPILQTGMYREQVYFVQPYFAAGALTRQMERVWSLNDVRTLLLQIETPLQAAHDAGIVHGRLKPSNILFGENATPHLSDFGLQQMALANSGGWRGNALRITPYTAPEQIAGRPVDARTDVYALSVLAAQLLGRDDIAERDPVARPRTISRLADSLTEPAKRGFFAKFWQSVGA